MQKLKNLIKKFLRRDGILYKGISKIYHALSTIKYKITNAREINEKNKYYTSQVDKAVEILLSLFSIFIVSKNSFILGSSGL